MTPEDIGESLRSSKRVVAFLTNDMFRTDQKLAHDWSDVSLSLSLALNKHLIIIMLEDIDHSLLRSRKDVKAALKVCEPQEGGGGRLVDNRVSRAAQRQRVWTIGEKVYGSNLDHGVALYVQVVWGTTDS